MRPIPRTLAGLVVAGSLLILPAAITHAAPAGPGAHRGTAPMSLSYVASVEGVTPQVLQQDLQAGETLLQIAQTAHSKYAGSAQTLATALLAPLKSRLDQAVTAGRISQAQESQRYNSLLGRMTSLVTTPHPLLSEGRFGGPTGAQGQYGGPRGYGMHMRGPLLTALTTACNTTPAALQAAIRTGGKTLLAICQSTNGGVTESSLVTTIVGTYKTRLDASVKAGRITAAQESQFLARLQTRVETLLTTPLPASSATPSA